MICNNLKTRKNVISLLKKANSPNNFYINDNADLLHQSGTGEYFSMYCGYCTDMNLEAECYIDNEGNNYGNSLPADFSSGASIENCPDDYYDCSVEADKITSVTTNLGNPTDTPLTVLIKDNCSTIIDTTHSGNYTAGWYQFSYDGTNLGTGVYQQVFIASDIEYTRNFYICSP